MHYDFIVGNVALVRQELDAACLAAGRNPADVTLVAISKFHPAEAIAAAAAAGCTAFGENYLQECQAKQATLAHLPIQWHFTGHIQSRKARELAGRFALIHAVDSLKVATILHTHSQELGVMQPILLQVNVGREPQKHGLAPEDVESVARQVLQLEQEGSGEQGGVRLDGLMCLPPWLDDPAAVQPFFAQLRDCRNRVQDVLGRAMPQLSMGMSHDFVQAVAEGATLVRIGTAIFGERPATKTT